MPLPSDTKVVEVGKQLVDTLHGIFGSHPGFRPAHAKGILLEGTFVPTAEARVLSVAPHFNAPETPVLARFSSSTGLPQLPDTDPNGDPRGFAVRFKLGDSPRRVHTDIVSHSTPFFPASNVEETLEFFKGVADGTVGSYLSTHPAAQAFVAAPKPTPSSFSRETYFSVNAFRLVDAEGKGTYIRYRFVPLAGEDFLDAESLQKKSENFLFQDIRDQVLQGPVRFHLVAQVAADGDVTDDNTIHWPDDRKVVVLGTISLDKVLEHSDEQQKNLIFDPMPRVAGIEPSADPLLDLRAAIYLISGRERRAA